MQTPGPRRTKDGLLICSGAAIMLIVLLVLQSFVGGGDLLGRNTRTVTVTMTSSDPYEQVSDAYAYHLAQFTAGNISAVVSGYERNATVEWVGPAYANPGNYSGSGNIDILLGSFSAKFNNNFSLSNEYQSMAEAKGNNTWMVNSTFDFRGYDAIIGNVNGTVLAQDTYVQTGNSWLIAHELWNFTQYYVQFPFGTG